MKRVSLAGLLGFIGLVALSLAALVNATGLWAGIVCTLTFGLLFAGILGVILRGRGEPVWIGLVVFGWGFVVLDFVPRVAEQERQLSGALADWVFGLANPAPVQPPGLGNGTVSPYQQQVYFEAQREYQNRQDNARSIGHCLLVLLLGQVGAILGSLLTRRMTSEEKTVPSKLSSP